MSSALDLRLPYFSRASTSRFWLCSWRFYLDACCVYWIQCQKVVQGGVCVARSCWVPCGLEYLWPLCRILGSILCTMGSWIPASLFMPVLGLGPQFLPLWGWHTRGWRRLLLWVVQSNLSILPGRSVVHGLLGSESWWLVDVGIFLCRGKGKLFMPPFLEGCCCHIWSCRKS